MIVEWTPKNNHIYGSLVRIHVRHWRGIGLDLPLSHTHKIDIFRGSKIFTYTYIEHIFKTGYICIHRYVDIKPNVRWGFVRPNPERTWLPNPITVLIHSNPMGEKIANIACMPLLVFRTLSGGDVVSSSNCVDYPIQYGDRDAAVCTPRSPNPAYARHATDRIPRTTTLCALLKEKHPRPLTDLCTARPHPEHSWQNLGD